MKILVIATCFYPDTAVAAKRPYFMSKYLSDFGHDVTVLRSGEIFELLDPSLDPEKEGFRIFSYLGDHCAAERHKRGEVLNKAEYGKKNFGFLPDAIRRPLVTFYRKALPGMRFLDWKQKRYQWFLKMKDYLDSMKAAGETFDVVFATYGDLENIWGGEYAGELFGCPWVMDLRDPLVAPWAGYFGSKVLLKMEMHAIDSCAACVSVSHKMAELLSRRHATNKVYTIHNGYDATAIPLKTQNNTPKLRFCYTGTLYKNASNLTALFSALKSLLQCGQIELEKVQFDYAGRDFPELFRQASKFGVESILIDHGYITKAEAFEIQDASDYFIVATWDTEKEPGGLTGKFYEGIRAKKPILSFVSGNVPDCELYLMNENYHYGFCYVYCKENALFDALCTYLKEAYDRKMRGDSVEYAPMPELATDFSYDRLAKKLETLFQNIVEENNQLC